ncbi:UBP-type zinc finger domain-containing protein [Croceiramulus getboli]|nr:UBP-type zinc finger domain-containing protein [Flavobacteriaceae bacterium YJPT1-3]
MALPSKKCEHLQALNPLSLKRARTYSCEECIKTGGEWVHLRTCQSCGITLCCDSSPNKHARKHFHREEHPVVISAEPGEYWAWCYADKTLREF